MTARRLISTIPLAALFLALAAGSAILNDALTVYATPEMQSQFLRDYNPEQVFGHFRASSFPGSRATGGDAGAGFGFATHSKHVDQELIIRYADRGALMKTLDRDMASLLTGTGAQILENSGNDRDGFHLRYTSGKITGTAIIMPPEPIVSSVKYLRQLLRPGEVDVLIRISMKETWFKSGVPTSPS